MASAAPAELASKQSIVRDEFRSLLELARATNAKDAREEGEALREFASADDVTLAYLTSIAEDLTASSGDAEDFDEEAFAETMCAYVPPLSVLDSAALKKWIVAVAGKLDDAARQLLAPSCSQQQQQSSLPAPEPGSSVPAAGGRYAPEPEEQPPSAAVCGLGCSAGKAGCAASGESEREDMGGAMDERVALLVEMFGGMCSRATIQRCLRRAEGDIDRAVQELLDCGDNDDDVSCACESAGVRSDSTAGVGDSPDKSADVMGARGRDDRMLKASILSRYGYVASDGRGGSSGQHCPKAVVTEEKKLIRYRDGQVVSTKGERYVEVKKQETEEMKKTYISLKPLKKYRWH